MAPTVILFCSILFLSGLTGADGASTVSNVAIQRGRSVTIPCHYDRKYENDWKYWCWGRLRMFCHTVVHTDSPKVNGNTSITDNPTNHVFTVTMTNLKTEDSGYYWCAVETKGGGNELTYLYLSVTADTPGLWVDQQEVTGVEGGHVSVWCHYNEPSSMKKWCRAEGSCEELNSGKSGRSEIKDDRSKKVFIVTVRELNRKDTGWYWCAAGELQIPVHITVTQKTTATTVTTHTLDADVDSLSQSHESSTLVMPTDACSTFQTSCPENGSQECSRAPTCMGRTLGVLRHTGVALVFLICTAVALWKICRKSQGAAGQRE